MKARVFLFILCFLLAASAAYTDKKYVKHPLRIADQVQDVTKPYQPSGWIISTVDESEGDQAVDNAPETDIRGVTACYDDAFIRVDMHLYNPIQYKLRLFYAVKIEYTDMAEYFTYYPDSKEFVYEKEEDGKITETEQLESNEEGDQAGVTSSGDDDDSLVFLIFNKKDHVEGEAGKKYFISTKYFAGYVDKDDKMHIADETVVVDLQFKM